MTKKKKQSEAEDPHAVERAALKVQFEREIHSHLGHLRTILRMGVAEGLEISIIMKGKVGGPETKINIREIE